MQPCSSDAVPGDAAADASQSLPVLEVPLQISKPVLKPPNERRRLVAIGLPRWSVRLGSSLETALPYFEGKEMPPFCRLLV
jgi:hypothetical protein